MANALNFIISEARRYAKEGYREGANNRNKFSDIVNRYGLAGCQNQPWCATFQFALELMAFGKAAALSHWNMSASNYCGYSCFETEKKFAAKRKTSATPKVGALVIFKRSHMGRVVSIDKTKKTFECIEGNAGDRVQLRRYSFTDAGIKSFCLIEYGDSKLTAEKLIGALRAAYEQAHYIPYVYSDSGTLPPCVVDKRISCDRLEALACWILGYTNQPKGGFTVVNMERFLLSWGWTKNTDPNKVKDSDFVLMRQNGTTAPMWRWHAFSVVKFRSVNSIDKFDTGSDARIRSAQPFKNVRLNEWGDKTFYASYHAPISGTDPKKKDVPSPSSDPDKWTFDADFYAYAQPDVVRAVGKSAAALRKHYDEHGKKEGRQANTILTPSYYRGKYADVRKTFGKKWPDIILHFVEYGRGEARRGSIVFDPVYYKKKYKLSGANWTLYRHFLNTGMSKGYQGSADFDPKIYKSKYSDISKAYGNNWKYYYYHYLVYGIKEGRKGV